MLFKNFPALRLLVIVPQIRLSGWTFCGRTIISRHHRTYLDKKVFLSYLEFRLLAIGESQQRVGPFARVCMLAIEWKGRCSFRARYSPLHERENPDEDSE